MPKNSWKIIFVLLVTFILRVPSFFEPNWYGDEGIYLAIGQALQRGAILYRDIWDNKPPLLYLIYAIVPILLWAKVTATVCVLATVFFVYKITKNIFAPLLTGILLSIPMLEGTIANAELYFTLPIVISAYLLIHNTKYLIRNTIIIGICLALAFLLKVPAIFDFIGLFLAYSIINIKNIKSQIKFYLIVSIPIVIFILYFSFYFLYHKAFFEFITASFLQNASYVSVDSGPLSKLSNPLFIKGIILVIFTVFSAFFYWRKKISDELLFLSLWLGFSLYGALLSNRPYLHYLLQIVPPAIILFNYLLKNLKKNLIHNTLYIILIYYLWSMFHLGFALPTKQYYENWYQYITEQKSWSDYANWFDNRTTSNYEIGRFLKNSTLFKDTVFVWGDNAFIYVLSKVAPTTKFIQAHHLSTIDQKNYDEVFDQLKNRKPKFIVIVQPVRFPFKQLDELVAKNYKLVKTVNGTQIYQMSGNIFNKPTR